MKYPVTIISNLFSNVFAVNFYLDGRAKSWPSTAVFMGYFYRVLLGETALYTALKSSNAINALGRFGCNQKNANRYGTRNVNSYLAYRRVRVDFKLPTFF